MIHSMNVCHIAAYIHNNETAEECQTYAAYLEELLLGELLYLAPHPTNDIHHLLQTTHPPCDLLLLTEPPQSWLKKLLLGTPAQRLVHHLPTSALVVRQPRWPLRHILFITRLDETDETAARWVTQLARRSRAAVTILPIVPAVTAMYQHGSYAHLGLDVTMALTHSRELSQIVHELLDHRVAGVVRVRQGEPQWQIRREVSQEDYDLVIVAAEPYGRFSRWFFGELVAPLLNWIDRPTLVARP